MNVSLSNTSTTSSSYEHILDVHDTVSMQEMCDITLALMDTQTVCPPPFVSHANTQALCQFLKKVHSNLNSWIKKVRLFFSQVTWTLPDLGQEHFVLKRY